MPYNGILEADKLRLWTKPAVRKEEPAVVDAADATLVGLEIEPVY